MRNLKKEKKRRNVGSEKHFPDSLDLFWFSSFLISCVWGGGGDQRNVVAPLFYFPFGCFLLLYSSMGDGSFGSLSVVSRVVQDRRVDVRAGSDWVRLGLALYLLLLLPGRPSRRLQPPKQLVAP